MTLHPWLETPEALEAARQAAQIPLRLMGDKAASVGQEELESLALVIMIECALQPRNRLHTECAQCASPLDGLRAGARFCSKECRAAYAKSAGRDVPKPSKAVHIGAMYSWPENDMQRYAVREVGSALCNHLRVMLRDDAA